MITDIVTAEDQGLHHGFRAMSRRLPKLLDALVNCPAHQAGVVPRVPRGQGGVYLFSEGLKHRYVGRTDDFRRRLGDHTRPSSRGDAAPFAFNIAKKEALTHRIPIEGTRKEVERRPGFATLFAAAKWRVRAMDYRFVVIDRSESALETIFEVYAAVALGTEGEFNLFANH